METELKNNGQHSVAEEIASHAISDISLDGRSRRAAVTRTKLIAACREAMIEGQLRPGSKEIAQRAGYAERTVYFHFPSLADLRCLALHDDRTRHQVMGFILDTDDELSRLSDASKDRLVWALITGVLTQTRPSFAEGPS
jgi:AcrR family transcriptional regulator